MRFRLGDPRVVPCFRCLLLLDMPPSETSGSPSCARAQFFPDGIGLNRVSSGSALPSTPVIRFRRGRHFAASLRFAFATACRFARLPGGSDQAFAQPTETFTPELSAGRLPFPWSGITTVATEQVPPVVLSTTGATASIAALIPCLDGAMSSSYPFSSFVCHRGSACRVCCCS